MKDVIGRFVKLPGARHAVFIPPCPEEVSAALAKNNQRISDLITRAKSIAASNALTKARRPSTDLVHALAEREAIKAGISIADILGPSRKQKISRARFRVWRELRDLDYSLPGIASRFNRDHTSCLSGLRRLAALEALEAG